LRNGFPTTRGAYGDAIADAVFLATDEPAAAARPKAREGSLHVIERRGLHTQITWKIYEGGNHFDHVNIGVPGNSE
jgi:hypothetical protein